MTEGGLAISGDTAVGTSSGYSGDIRVGENYGSDQYSQIVLSSTQLTGGQWVGPTVRSQNGGQDTYLGIYFWQDGNPSLQLYERSGGTWTQLGDSYPVAPLPAGTVLTLVAIGSKISFLENGVERITATDDTLTGGNPGLLTFGPARAASWAGDDATATNPAVKYSVGGTVSGLSGTLGLQDSAGDDLTDQQRRAVRIPDAAGRRRRLPASRSPTAQPGRRARPPTPTARSPPRPSPTSPSTAPTPPPGDDDFDRSDSPGLGAGWAAMTDGGLAISGDTAVGTSSGYSGDIRVAENYGSDQYSQIVLSSTQLTGGQWIGPTVRSQNGGQDTYLGIYFWQDGNPSLELYKRSGGTWTQLGDSYPVAPLPAGTVLTLVAIGSQISLLGKRRSSGSPPPTTRSPAETPA